MCEDNLQARAGATPADAAGWRLLVEMEVTTTTARRQRRGRRRPHTLAAVQITFCTQIRIPFPASSYSTFSARYTTFAFIHRFEPRSACPLLSATSF